ncbi:divergent polysaccharide deacetylase family protein [Primorskyibacter marinus]|uniref:divergent polysaccharide deacetylase family protein n=1 Tax=Primorskyibacter marinus TaxID=1977320 RepID=UPI0013005765|nr:divergent polysaccharide deacetylase family protein [Primorskyibacter marinus]
MTAVAGAGALSLAVGMPQPQRPEVVAVEVPAGSAFDDVRDDRAATRPASETSGPAGEAPRITAPVPDDLARLADADTMPVAAPSPDMGANAMTAPDAGVSSGAVTVQSETPAPVAVEPSAAPATPEAETRLTVSTEPANPPASLVEERLNGLTPPEDATDDGVFVQSMRAEAINGGPVPQPWRPNAGVAMFDAPAQPAPPTAEDTTPPAAIDTPPAATVSGLSEPSAPAPFVNQDDPGLAQDSAEDAPTAGGVSDATAATDGSRSEAEEPADAPVLTDSQEAAVAEEKEASDVVIADVETARSVPDDGNEQPADRENAADTVAPTTGGGEGVGSGSDDGADAGADEAGDMDSVEATQADDSDPSDEPPAITMSDAQQDEGPAPADTDRAEASADTGAEENVNLGAEEPSMAPPEDMIAESAPVIGSQPVQTAAPDASAELPGNAVALAELSPLERFGAPFQPAGEKPLLSVILIDDGTGPLGPDAIDGFPFAVTFALDAASPDARQRMTLYREKGYEVMALADLPQEAGVNAAEGALDALLNDLPEVVAVLEGDQAGLQGARAISDRVTQTVLQSGHGLVMRPNGQNSAQLLAVQQGVPAATAFRDLDGQGQGQTAIRRFLDQATTQATSRAGREQPIILLGRLRAETLASLMLWGMQDQTKDAVDIVPVSSFLLQLAD